MGVGGAGGEEDRVGVPGEGGDGAADGLLEVLGDPPVVLGLEVAHGDEAVARTDGELGLGRGPADEGGGAVDAQQDEGGLVALRGGLPDEGVAVLRARHDAARAGGDVDAGHGLVVALELVLELEGGAGAAIELDGGVAGDGEGLVVGRERVVRDRVVEQVVHLGRRHLVGLGGEEEVCVYAIGVALDYRGRIRVLGLGVIVGAG